MPDIVTAPAPVAPAASTPPATPAPAPAATPKPGDNAGPGSNGKPVPPAPDAKGSPPADAKVTEVKKEEAPANPDKPYKITAGGKTYHVSMDEALNLASKGIGASQKFEEASGMRQQVEKFLTTLKTDPMSILLNPKIGLDFKKLAQEFLVKEIEREAMTPEQRELADAKRKIEEIENEKKTAKQKEEAAVMERLTQEAHANYEKDIISTLEAEKLPKTRFIVGRLAYYMEQGLRRGIDLTAKDVVPFVRKEINANITDMFTELDGESLAQILGDGNVKKINEALLAKMKNGAPVPTIKPSGDGTPRGNEEPVKKLSKVDWRREMDKKF